jgi:hypothetical protein
MEFIVNVTAHKKTRTALNASQIQVFAIYPPRISLTCYEISRVGHGFPKFRYCVCLRHEECISVPDDGLRDSS